MYSRRNRGPAHGETLCPCALQLICLVNIRAAKLVAQRRELQGVELLRVLLRDDVPEDREPALRVGRDVQAIRSRDAVLPGREDAVEEKDLLRVAVERGSDGVPRPNALHRLLG